MSESKEGYRKVLGVYTTRILCGLGEWEEAEGWIERGDLGLVEREVSFEFTDD